MTLTGNDNAGPAVSETSGFSPSGVLHGAGEDKEVSEFGLGVTSPLMVIDEDEIFMDSSWLGHGLAGDDGDGIEAAAVVAADDITELLTCVEESGETRPWSGMDLTFLVLSAGHLSPSPTARGSSSTALLLRLRLT